MTEDERNLQRLIDLESTADSCIHEICNLLDDDQYYNAWYRIHDGIDDKITSLKAKIEFEKSEK